MRRQKKLTDAKEKEAEGSFYRDKTEYLKLKKQVADVDEDLKRYKED